MAYIGVSPSNGVRQKHTYTATASQTTFSGAGSEGVSLSYRDSNYVDVYVNGVKLGDADYTATSGTSIVLAVGAAVSDIVEIITYDVFSVADTVSKADGGTFDGNVAMAGTLDVTGDLTVDTSTLHVDSANNRVGVGTVSPDRLLHIYEGNSGITPNTSAHLTLESDGANFLNIIKPNSTVGGIAFSGNSTNADGRITYDDSGASRAMQFYTASTEAMRIDSSGNLLVGVTSTTIPGVGNTTEGVSLRGSTSSASSIFASRATASAGYFNINADGDILSLRRSGTQIGCIGVTSSDQFYIARNTGNHGIKFKNSATMPSSSAGADADNAQDLGSSSVRWKDLYLSGGVYLGGTGSANYLDDYEEGTFTPIVASTGTNPTVTYSIQEGNYTKIGRQVTITAEIRFSAYTDNGGSFRLEGIPFSVLTDTNYRAVGMISLSNVAVDLTGDYSNLQLAYNSGNSMQVIQNSSVTTGDAETPTSKIDAGTRMRYQITYFTA